MAENALRPLLTRALAASLIPGYDEWVYLNVPQERADDPARVEEVVADALKAPREIECDALTLLVEVPAEAASVLDELDPSSAASLERPQAPGVARTTPST